MKLELINLEKQTANGLSTSRTKATPNSLDRYAALLKNQFCNFSKNTYLWRK
jgi:hypothetical protein